MSFNVWAIPFFGPTGTKDELTISIYVNQPLTFFRYLILTHTSTRKLSWIRAFHTNKHGWLHSMWYILMQKIVFFGSSYSARISLTWPRRARKWPLKWGKAGLWKHRNWKMSKIHFPMVLLCVGRNSGVSLSLIYKYSIICNYTILIYLSSHCCIPNFVFWCFLETEIWSDTVFSIPQAVTPSALKACVQLCCRNPQNDNLSIIYVYLRLCEQYFFSRSVIQWNESIVRVSINFVVALDKDHQHTQSVRHWLPFSSKFLHRISLCVCETNSPHL